MRMTGFIAMLLALALVGCVAAKDPCAASGKPLELPDQTRPRLREQPPGTLFAGTNGASLSLEQAVWLALSNNRDLEIQRLTSEMQGAYERIARGEYDPEVFAELRFLDERATEVARSTGEAFDVEAEERRAGVGLRQRLPTGTELEIAAEQEHRESDRTPEQEEAALSISLTQALLRGVGPAVNLVAVRQAQLGVQASLHELRGFIEALVAETEIAYWRYVLAQQEIAIFERSLSVAQQQRKEVEQLIEVGSLAETEAAASRAEVARRHQDLIDARSERESRQLRLLRWMAPDALDRLSLAIEATADPVTTLSDIGDVVDHLALALQMRADLNEARLRLEQDRLEVTLTRNGLLPRLDFFTELRKTGFGDSFDDSFGEWGGDTYEATAGLRLVHVIGNRAAQGRDRLARVSAQRAAAAVENLRDTIRFEVRLALAELKRSREQIDASAATLALQEETWKAERDRYNVGNSTALLVAQTQRDLLAARIAEVEAVIHYRIALVNLYRAEGSLLERRGISIPALNPRPENP